jgi:uncharacterized protein (TIGR03086 family)
MDAVTGLERSYDQLGGLLTNLSLDQLALASPCADWDVRAMLNHTLGAVRMFTLVNEGQPAAEDAGDLVGSDPCGALKKVAEPNLASWRKPGALDGDRTFPFGTFPAQGAIMINLGEVLVHAWDVARATGQGETLDPDAASVLYEFYAAMPLDEYRAHGAFGPEVAVPTSAPVQQRLLGLLGRQP